jgi:hypothetical protein
MSSAPDSLKIREADLLGRGLRDRSDLCEEDDRDEIGDGEDDDMGSDTAEASSNVEAGLPSPSGIETTETDEPKSVAEEEEGGRWRGKGENG